MKRYALHLTHDPPQLDGSNNDKRDITPKPCVAPATHCYCVVPIGLYRECNPLITGYNNGRIEHSCENFQRYAACAEKSKAYCTPDRPSGFRRSVAV